MIECTFLIEAPLHSHDIPSCEITIILNSKKRFTASNPLKPPFFGWFKHQSTGGSPTFSRASLDRPICPTSIAWTTLGRFKNCRARRAALDLWECGYNNGINSSTIPQSSPRIVGMFSRFTIPSGGLMWFMTL